MKVLGEQRNKVRQGEPPGGEKPPWEIWEPTGPAGVLVTTIRGHLLAFSTEAKKDANISQT